MLALDIIESDGIEETTGKPVDEDGKPAKSGTKKSNRPATNEERRSKRGIDRPGRRFYQDSKNSHYKWT